MPNFGPMNGIADIRRSGFRTTVVLYGLALAALVIAPPGLPARDRIPFGNNTIDLDPS